MQLHLRTAKRLSEPKDTAGGRKLPAAALALVSSPGWLFCSPVDCATPLYMKKTLPFLVMGFLAAAAITPAEAQTNFRPGYVVSLSGDTLRGEVDSRDARASAQRCRFRAASADVVTYAPTGLRAYGLPGEGKHYRALVVALPPAAPQAYFLETVADGPAALYFLRDDQQHEFFFVASPSLPLALLDHGFARVVRDGHTYNEERTPYRNTLAVALAGCPAAQSELPRLPFLEGALRRVVRLYNACQGQLGPPAPVALTRVAVGLLAGAAQHTLFYSGFPVNRGGSAVIRRPGFAVGPVLRFTSSRLSPKLSVVLALLYEPEKFEFDVVNGEIPGPFGSRAHTIFDLAYLRLPLMVRYTYPRGKVSPLAEVGFTVAYALKTTNSVAIIGPNGQYVVPPYSLLLSSAFRTIQLGAGVGLGLSARRADGRALALLGRAEITNGFTNSTGAGSAVLHLYALLSYDLTK